METRKQVENAPGPKAGAIPPKEEVGGDEVRRSAQCEPANKIQATARKSQRNLLRNRWREASSGSAARLRLVGRSIEDVGSEVVRTDNAAGSRGNALGELGADRPIAANPKRDRLLTDASTLRKLFSAAANFNRPFNRSQGSLRKVRSLYMCRVLESTLVLGPINRCRDTSPMTTKAMGARIQDRLTEIQWTGARLAQAVNDLHPPEPLEPGTLYQLISRNGTTNKWSDYIAEALGVSHRWLQWGVDRQERTGGAAVEPQIALNLPIERLRKLPPKQLGLVATFAIGVVESWETANKNSGARGQGAKKSKSANTRKQRRVAL